MHDDHTGGFKECLYTNDITVVGKNDGCDAYVEGEGVELNSMWAIGPAFIIFLGGVLSSSIYLASYTYGPLLGLFAFGLYTNYSLREKYIYAVVILAPILTYILSISPTLYAYNLDLTIIECTQEKWLCAKSFALSNFYQFGYELLPINGVITFVGLYLSRNKEIRSNY